MEKQEILKTINELNSMLMVERRHIQNLNTEEVDKEAVEAELKHLSQIMSKLAQYRFMLHQLINL